MTDYIKAYLDEDEGRILDTHDYSASKFTEQEMYEAGFLVRDTEHGVLVSPERLEEIQSDSDYEVES